MGTFDNLQSAVGEWQGTSQLWLPDEPTRQSATLATVALAIMGKFYQITYTWMYDNAPQEGLLLIAIGANQTVNGVFADSWHMGDAMMVCQGQVSPTGVISMRGSYAVEASPDWGWRIDIAATNPILSIVMFNVTPAGQEMRGFELKYSPVAAVPVD